MSNNNQILGILVLCCSEFVAAEKYGSKAAGGVQKRKRNKGVWPGRFDRSN
jgi:hypothetical protein